MSPEVDRLLGLLDDMVALLRAQGEERWADWVQADATLIRDQDGRGIDHFLAAFGSAGSLYDLVFHPLNGNAETDAEGREVTERFHELVAEAHPIALDLSRELATAD